MNYNFNGSLPDSLGLTPKRVRQLNNVFSTVCDSLPGGSRRTELHQRLAPFINTPEEGYYMGNLVREYINNLEAMAPQPITLSCN